FGSVLSSELHDGAAISLLRSNELVRTRPEPNGNHRWEGVILACGPSIRSGLELAELSIVDVAPLVLHSMGLPVPADMDGRVPEAALRLGGLGGLGQPSRPSAQPACAVATQPSSGPPVAVDPAEPGYDSESELVILSRLRALGYLD